MALARWISRRDAALVTRKPDGFQLETSFTNQQPMHGWVQAHAVRELWQNLRDGVSQTFGHDISPSFSPTRVTLSSSGEDVAYADWSAPSKLVLWQKYAVLETRHLLLASHKADSGLAGVAGCHGEGFKVAINYLLRAGFGATYAMNGQDWTFLHRACHSSSEDIRSMVVIMRHAIPRDSLTITITGPGAHKLFDINVDWALFRTKTLRAADPAALQSNSFCVLEQEIVLTRAVGAAGRAYNRGLFVDVSDELRSLGLCVNLDFDLQRDRHKLPANLPHKVGDVLQQVISLNGLESPTVKTLCEALFERLSAGGRPAEWLAPAVRDYMRSFYATRHGVPDANIVFLTTANGTSASLLEAVGLTPILSSGALADTSDVSDMILRRLGGMPSYNVTAPAEVQRLGWLRKLAATMQRIVEWTGFSLELKVKTLPNDTSVCMMELKGAGMLFYLSSQCISEQEGWRATAAAMLFEVLRYKSAAYRMPLSQALADFMKDPQLFSPERFGSLAGSSSGGGLAGAGGGGIRSASSSSAGGGGGGAGGAAASMGIGRAASRAAASSAPSSVGLEMRFREEALPDIRPHAITGVPTSLPGHDERYLDAPVTCRVPRIDLRANSFHIPASERGPVRDITIQVDPTVLDNPIFRSRYTNFANAFGWLLPDIEQLAVTVATTVRLGRPLPLVFVICENVRGFNYGGRIYLNVWPLAHVNLAYREELEVAGQSILLTLLHEVAHWNHPQHDEGFADFYGRLVWACRKSL